MRGSRVRIIAGTAVVAIAVAACSGGGSSNKSNNSSSSSGTAGSSSSSAALKSVTVGLLTDVTGPAASGNKLSQTGVEGGKVYAARNGYKIKVVVADTQTNPSAVL